MKKTVIGGFLALCGMIGSAAAVFAAGIAPADTWQTPPGRFISTLLQNGTDIFFALSVCVFMVGTGILAVEYIREAVRSPGKEERNIVDRRDF